MILTGLVPWNFFAQSLTYSSGSLVNNANLVTKVYFPRLVMPIAPVLACFVDFCVACVLLFFIMAYYAAVPSALIWLMPFMLLLNTSFPSILFRFRRVIWISVWRCCALAELYWQEVINRTKAIQYHFPKLITLADM